MTERNDGYRRALTLAPVYRIAQRLVGARKSMAYLARDVIKARPGDCVVDIGCGTADLLEHLPAVNYVGFDPNGDYVTSVQARYRERSDTTVFEAAIGDDGLTDRLPERADVVLAIGVLHHLDDELAGEALALARRVLAPGGRFVAFDGGLVEGQPRMARALVVRDRGQHVRTLEETTRIVRRAFPSANVAVRHDLLHVPYTHFIVVAEADEGPR
jgi:SAM-dependent methyltransferase